MLLSALTLHHFTLPSVSEQSIVVSLSVCLSVCPRAYLQNCNMCSIYQIFVHVTSGRPGLGPPLVALQYVIYFRFVENVISRAIWRHVDTVAVSDVISTSCAGYSAPAASHWLHRVLDLAGAETRRVLRAGGAMRGGSCNALLLITPWYEYDSEKAAIHSNSCETCKSLINNVFGWADDMALTKQS